MKLRYHLALPAALVLAMTCLIPLSFARKVVWISDDAQSDNRYDKTLLEGYYRQNRGPNDTLQFGGDPNNVWCTMQAGDTFIIVAHGGGIEFEDGQGGTIPVSGGMIIINDNGHAGFGPTGSNGGGTGLPSHNPFRLQPKTTMAVTVIVVACYSSNPEPSQNPPVTPVTASFDNTLVGAGSTIIGAQALVQFGDVSFEFQGTRNGYNRIWTRLRVLTQSNDNAGVYEWLNRQPLPRRQAVLDSIIAAEQIEVQTARWQYSAPRGLDGQNLLVTRPDRESWRRLLDDEDTSAFIDTLSDEYVNEAPCVTPAPGIDVGGNRCLQFTPRGLIHVEWYSDLPGPPVLHLEPGCDGERDACDPANIFVIGPFQRSQRPGVWAVALFNLNNAPGCATLHLDAMLPVELTATSAIYEDGAVHFSWRTASETAVESFRVYRRSEREPEFALIAANLAPRGTPASGADYRFVDHHVVAGTDYEYLLADVSIAGAETRFMEHVAWVRAGNTIAAPRAFVLYQNHPNPFNASTEIRFEIPAAGLTRLVLFDLQGREVQLLQAGEISAGIHSVHYDASGLPTGTYFYRLESNGQSALRKLVLLK